MMTLEQIKLAVCEKLPELLHIKNHGSKDSPVIDVYWKPYKHWEPKALRWPTEGLQVCHEAEKLLSFEEIELYRDALSVGNKDKTDNSAISNFVEHFSYEQRLEALCRVWYPERFKD